MFADHCLHFKKYFTINIVTRTGRTGGYKGGTDETPLPLDRIFYKLGLNISEFHYN